ncbi:DUF2516 family protein [Sanguibacter inulinus]|jgi:hypothetical protein|uniref:DUF2516 family protein n=1 Tax=Sanguibacter inulinus TaxID=60922 RepID=A0A853EXK8_9MICO|nr:DUF2516 family protein [Sanguibacter inulinus]MBF0724170.1 DUF2516 family protein [Sanguibacter inulinus]NYS95315.1 DUF2516 family protein [Sanguibacter inulinus]
MFATLQISIMVLLTLALFVVEVFALIDALRRPAGVFTSAGKRTKVFWGSILAAGALLGFVGLYPPLGIGMLGMAALFMVVPAAIYLTDVRPALGSHRRGGGRPGSGPSRGGW